MIPFSNVIEFIIWQDRNCEQCKKYENESTERDEAGCKLAFDIDLGSIGDGTIPESTAKMIGVDKRGSLKDICSSRNKDLFK